MKNNRAIVLVAVPLVVLVGCFVVWFVSSERAIYTWDFANYWRPSIDLSNQLQDEQKAAAKSIVNSLRNDEYNLLHATPPAVWMIVFGTSRLSYELALYILYFVPATLCLALLAYRLIYKYVSEKSRPIRQLIFTGIWGLTLINPLLLGPLLRGYPDIIGLGLLAAAILIYMAKRTNLLTRWLFLIAAILVLATFMRRWYIFGSVGLIIGMGIDQLRLLYGSHKKVSATIFRLSKLLVLPATYILLFVGIAWPYVKRLLSTDYASNYSAYRRHEDYFELFGFTLSHFSVPIVILSVLSIGWLIYRGRSRAALLVIMCAAVFSFLAVGRIQSFDPHQYYLLSIPMIIGIGTFPFVAADVLKTKFKNAGVYAAITVLAVVGVNFYSMFINFLNAAPITTRLNTAPMVRGDIQILVGMYDDMRRMGSDKMIYVLSCTNTFNIDTVRNIPMSIGGVSPVRYDNYLHTSQLDARDGFNVRFFETDILIDSDPIGYIADLDDQRIITLLHDEVHSGVLKPYFAVVKTYAIDDDHTVYLFGRTSEIPQKVRDSIVDKIRNVYPEVRVFTASTPHG